MKKTASKSSKVSKISRISLGKKVAIGASLAAVGAGAYYLLGPKGKEHQKKALALMNKMQKEIKQKATKVKDMTKPIYDKAVDSLATTYSKQYKAHAEDIKAVAKKLKGEWKKIKAQNLFRINI